MKIGSRVLALALLLAGATGTACSVADVDGSRDAYEKKDGDDASVKDKHKAGDDDDDDDDDDNVVSKSNKGTTSKTDSAKLPDTDADAAPPATTDPFAGASGFTTLTPGTDTTRHHSGYAQQLQDCMTTCHNGKNTAPLFAVGGTVVQVGGKPAGATGVQVRVVDPSGAELALVGTDSQGNFWLKGDKKIPTGSHVAIRDGNGVERKMSGTISNGSCNADGCHGVNRPIFLNPGGN